ncbi:MAG: carbonic anhydrase [Candidatus Micrarchaeota archaeon]
MEKALEKMMEGNKRFVNGKNNPKNFDEQRKTVLNGQKPFVTILSCSDSRVVPEFIFDAGIGELFIVRTAGNVCDPVALGSIEYGTEHLHTPLLIVLGHEKCGAVTATYHGGEAGGNISAIITKIQPSIHTHKEGEGKEQHEEIEECIECNVRKSIENMRHCSTIIQHLEKEGKLKIVGMKYSLATGKVHILE